MSYKGVSETESANCGTPNSISCQNYMNHLLVPFVFCLISSYELISKQGKVKPYALSFAIRSPWLRQSNILYRSVSGAPKILFLSTAFSLFSIALKNIALC